MRNTFNTGMVITTPYSINRLNGQPVACGEVKVATVHIFPPHRYSDSTKVSFEEKTRLVRVNDEWIGIMPIGTKVDYLQEH